MARFLALGPLVLVLCLVFFTRPSPSHTEETEPEKADKSQSNISTPPTSPNSPADTPSKATQSNLTTPPTSSNSPADTPSKATQSNLTTSSTSSNSPAVTPSKESEPSPSHTPEQTSKSSEKGVKTGDADTQSNLSNSSTPTNTPSVTPSKGSTSDQEQKSTPISPAHITVQQHTSTTGSTSDQTTQTKTSISPALTTMQQHTATTGSSSQMKTSISPARTTMQQHTGTTDAGNNDTQSNLTTSSTSSNTSADTPSKATQSNLTTPSTSSNSPADTPSKGPSPADTPTQTPLSPGPATQKDIISPPNTTITLLTSTQPSSTLHTHTNTPGTKERQCQYSLMEIENKTTAYVVNINGSDYQTYTIRIKDKLREIRAEKISNQTAFKIPFEWLKPCTEYIVTVDECQPSERNSFTSKEGNISRAVVSSVTDTEVCLKGEFNDIQWNLTECVERTEKNSCSSTHTVQLDTCEYTMNVDLPPVKPQINFKETIPSQFEWTNKPALCSDPFIIKCTNHKNKDIRSYGLNDSVSLLPNTQYTCTGEYSYEKPIKSQELSFKITCDWQKNGRFQDKSSSSLRISWTSLDEDRCSGIEWDSFSVSCDHHNQICKKHNGTSTVCNITGLLPYKTYKCRITGRVNQTDYLIYTDDIKTLSDKPSFKSKVEVTHASHNSLEIKCEINGPKIVWNGEKGNSKLKSHTMETITEDTQDTCLFKFSDLYYLTTYGIKITAINKEGLSDLITSEATTKYNDKAVVGFLVFLIVVTTAALLFVLFKIYILKRKRAAEDEEILLTPEPLRRVEPIYADGLIEAYKTKIADESRLFMDEFQSIPRIFSNYTIKEAKKQENQSKNRYVDILPYDYNRVTLSASGEDDYINASFIEGYQEPKKYIAAQGPKDETVCDFWQMVWEQKSSIIVMVTRCEEGNKIKCAQYWPSLDRETEIFDDFVVKIRSEQHCPDFIIRHLILANKREKASEREVTHIQFISWPDHGVPGDPSLLLKLRRRVNSFKNFFSGPVVVHCSAGVGRTGTYIGIDAMIESLEAEGRVDIYGYVAKLRRQRCLMVQVEAQYVLIHTALIEHNQFGETEISLSEFHSAFNTLKQKDGTGPSLLEMEFQKLPKFKNWRTFNTGSSEDNKKKNRYSSVLPYDFNRVLFRLDIEGNQTSEPEDEEEYSSDEEEESNEYINASFIDGYWCHKSLITAQGPLANTTEEFLLMLYQQQTKTLVMLTDCQEDGNDYCFQYWGDEKRTFGDMEIEVKKTESFPTYVRRHLEIQSTKKKDVLEVDQYQFLKWRGQELPENTQELIEMIRVIRENGNYDNSRMNRNIPIVVHCNNGSSRSGIFCALWNLLDSVYTEKLLDVFQVVKNLRKERQGMVETFEQYQFIYAALEGAFPVQNGAVKSPPANDTAQVINETTALLDEPSSTPAAADQTEAKESNAEQSEAAGNKAAESSEKTDSTAGGEQEAEESSAAEDPPAEGDKPGTEGATNGPAATLEV
ncbi:LOW QUALITY PROTEIN: receptor-type tyrosine-protein phosphatase C [Puntigrus tetrazona]|uniref:LOW QUALITY PROTEIN: receptor-type tyrosine-protein phosphatase C n=1 Tax=Puntigrus tetrazona TaxID=1606681 RepID=UPI001C8AD2CB|nr:LOW QUALITY PROTEIN: receptor-type tyrosine-protein phosphatase C [Puntigrus tetrazona]